MAGIDTLDSDLVHSSELEHELGDPGLAKREAGRQVTGTLTSVDACGFRVPKFQVRFRRPESALRRGNEYEC
jgi:hypothetical protein